MDRQFSRIYNMKYKVLCIVMLLIIGKVEISIAGNQKQFKNYILPASFNTDISVLPKGYKGDDIVSIYNFLSNKYPKKDEFETKEAYESRISSNISNVVFSFVRDRVDKYRFSWNSDYLKYSPETEMMTIDIPTNPSSSVHNNINIIKIKRTNEKTKGSIGQNAFGAKVSVSLYTGMDYGIYPEGGYKKITFRVKPEEGRVLKQDYGLLLICKISPNMKTIYPFQDTEMIPKEIIGVGREGKSPTIDSSYELMFRNYFISVRVMEIWVFNKKTGYIYFKDKQLHTNEVSTNKQ